MHVSGMGNDAVSVHRQRFKRGKKTVTCLDIHELKLSGHVIHGCMVGEAISWQNMVSGIGKGQLSAA